MVVGPGLGVGRRSRGGVDARLRLAGVARDRHVHPLLRHGHLGADIPLALARCVGGVISNVGVAGGPAAQRRLLGVAVGQGNGGTFVNLGQARIGDGGVGLGFLLGFDGSLGVGVGRLRNGLSLRERSAEGDGNLLDLGD